MRPCLCLLLAALCLTSSLIARPARAGGEVTRATLSWVRLPGAESCIGAPALAETVEKRVGHPVFSPASQATLSVEGWVEPAQRPLKWRAVVTLADANGKALGSREVLSDAESCDGVVPSLALGIALMIDPETPHEEPKKDPGTAVVVTPAAGADEPVCAPKETAPVGTSARPSETATPPPSSLHTQRMFQVTLGPLVGVGAVPGINGDAVNPGLLLRLVAGPPTSWGIDAQIALFPPREIESSTSAYRAHVALLGCPLRRVWAVRFEACAGPAMGWIGTDGGYISPSAYIVDGLAELRIGHKPSSSPLVFSLGVTLGVPFHHPKLQAYFRNYLTPPVYGMADLAIGFEFL